MSDAQRQTTDTAAQAARALIAAAGLLVPRHERAAWRLQWVADALHRHAALLAAGRPPRTLRWSLGAVRHALWRRRRNWQPAAAAEDLRYAVRGLRRARGLAALVVVTMAIGIGATTAIFSVVYGTLLRPLPYPEPDQLDMVWQINYGWREMPDPIFQRMAERFPASYPLFEEWRSRDDIFSAVAAEGRLPLIWMAASSARQLEGAQITGDLVEVLGVRPQIGRWFAPEEDRLGAPRVAVLSHEFWSESLAADSEIVGTTMIFSDVPHSVVGVMPPRFDFPNPGVKVWVNLGDDARAAGWQSNGLRVIARRASGLSRADALARLEAFTANLIETNDAVDNVGVRLIARLEHEVGETRPSMMLLLGSVCLLLLLACANVTSLLLVRGAERRREVAVRAALGARRARIVRQFVTESIVLALAGGVVGAWVAWQIVPPMVRLLPSEFRAREVGVDGTVLAFAIAVATLTGVAVGVVACLDVVRRSPAATLTATSRALGGGIQQRALAGVVVAQVAIALVLVVGAALFSVSLQRLMALERGFSDERVLALSLMLPDSRYQEGVDIVTYVDTALERLRALPGVEQVAVTTALPMNGSTSSSSYTIEGREEETRASLAFNAINRQVSTGHFALLDIPRLAGRGFDTGDTVTAEPVAIVNERLAETFWPGENPLDKRLRDSANKPWVRVIGVVGNVRHGDLANGPQATIYYPFAQDPEPWLTFTLRGTAATPEAAPARQALWALDATVPIHQAQSVAEIVLASAARPRARTTLIATTATIALLLAVVGVYGAIAYAVRQRTHEIGIRIAVGARARNVVGDVLRWGLGLAGLGVAIGLAVSLAVGRLVAGFLYGVAPHDPATLIVGSAILLAVAACACGLPAWRAAATDPTTALRGD